MDVVNSLTLSFKITNAGIVSMKSMMVKINNIISILYSMNHRNFLVTDNVLKTTLRTSQHSLTPICIEWPDIPGQISTLNINRGFIAFLFSQ